MMRIYLIGSDTKNKNVGRVVMKRIHQQGFSLIELMVVLFIVAMIAGGVSQVVQPQGSITKRINQQGERVFAQMQFALDDALVRYSALGIVIQKDEDDIESTRKYVWYRYDGEDWKITDEPLGQQSLSEELVWSIEVEEVSVEESLDDLLDDEEKIKPVLVFSPSGEVSDFSMIITLSDQALVDYPEAVNQRYKIALNERGELDRFAVGEEEQ